MSDKPLVTALSLQHQWRLQTKYLLAVRSVSTPPFESSMHHLKLKIRSLFRQAIYAAASARKCGEMDKHTGSQKLYTRRSSQWLHLGAHNTPQQQLNVQIFQHSVRIVHHIAPNYASKENRLDSCTRFKQHWEGDTHISLAFAPTFGANRRRASQSSSRNLCPAIPQSRSTVTACAPGPRFLRRRP